MSAENTDISKVLDKLSGLESSVNKKFDTVTKELGQLGTRITALGQKSASERDGGSDHGDQPA